MGTNMQYELFDAQFDPRQNLFFVHVRVIHKCKQSNITDFQRSLKQVYTVDLYPQPST